MSKTREQLEDRAEYYIRSGGFASFSFRDLARDLGIKSASVHYHFPTKSDLGVAVAERYNQRFRDALPDPDTTDRANDALLRHYIGMFHTEMMESNRVCLCAVLSVERTTLSDDMKASLEAFLRPEPGMADVRVFQQDNRSWLNPDSSLSESLPDFLDSAGRAVGGLGQARPGLL